MKITKYRCVLVREEEELKYGTKQEKLKLDNPEKVYDFLKGHLDLEKSIQEQVWALYLSVKNDLIGYQIIGLGGIDFSPVNPADVFRSAIEAGAHGVILAHNHPSGDPEPSESDFKLTRQLAQGGILLCIRVLDHVVVGDRCYYSIREGRPDLFT